MAAPAFEHLGPANPAMAPPSIEESIALQKAAQNAQTAPCVPVLWSSVDPQILGSTEQAGHCAAIHQEIVSEGAWWGVLEQQRSGKVVNWRSQVQFGAKAVSETPDKGQTADGQPHHWDSLGLGIPVSGSPVTNHSNPRMISHERGKIRNVGVGDLRNIKSFNLKALTLGMRGNDHVNVVVSTSKTQ